MEEYMLPIKTLKIHIDNHIEIPKQTLKNQLKISIERLGIKRCQGGVEIA